MIALTRDWRQPPKKESVVDSLAWPYLIAQQALEELFFLRPHQCLSTTADAQFAKDVVEMALDRADGDDQLVGNLAIRETSGHQPQHLQLRFEEEFHQGESISRRRRSWAGSGEWQRWGSEIDWVGKAANRRTT